jgi:hypothetical protein
MDWGAFRESFGMDNKRYFSELQNMAGMGITLTDCLTSVSRS